ncbi:MAG: GIY-YIG nuclease family protein [Candidatus Babeliales bacterium]
MYYVYLIRSINSKQTYIGYTKDLNKRLACHNSGSSHHTKQYKPWEIIVALQFVDKQKAINFESYLKSGSGRAFIKKHFL